jgi:hypothetical protein
VFCLSSPFLDSDGDKLMDFWETCKWGSRDDAINADGDGLGDCKEVVDVNGDGDTDWLTDVLSYAQAALNGPSFGVDGDFDLDGDNFVMWLQDALPAIVLILEHPSEGGCANLIIPP